MAREKRKKVIALGSVPVFNISIIAMKRLLIQTPKDFYKTSISLS